MEERCAGDGKSGGLATGPQREAVLRPLALTGNSALPARSLAGTGQAMAHRSLTLGLKGEKFRA
jgi:hypothetical protein